MGGGAQWEPQQADLPGEYELVAVDLPGFGKNSHLPAIDTIGGFADWVIAELDRRDIKKYHLLGHSMGGMVVQEISRRDPGRIDHLILYATGAVGVLPGRFESIEESKKRAKIEGAKTTARRIAATWFLEKECAPAYRDCAKIAEQSTPAAISAGLDAMQSWSGVEFLPSIDSKTLVIWGDGDRTYQWPQIQLLWNTIRHASLAVVPDCAHAVHLEKPEIFNRLVLDFLNTPTRF